MSNIRRLRQRLHLEARQIRGAVQIAREDRAAHEESLEVGIFLSTIRSIHRWVDALQRERGPMTPEALSQAYDESFTRSSTDDIFERIKRVALGTRGAS